ncbi:MAG TPA: rubrerythrin [Phycisphaerales bacterium]|nr:rubrerythrin [Phycisphaerales bacterium]
MVMPFNADEIFEMAEQIERNGGKFYRAAAEKFPAVNEVLLGLAAMEDEHLKTFADMRAELSGTEVEEPVFDPDGQAQMYLRVMADGNVFDVKADPVEQLAMKNTPEDVLKMAIGVERDSIAFYVGLKEAVSRRAGKDKVDDIIKEEMGHIVTLNEKLQDLT